MVSRRDFLSSTLAATTGLSLTTSLETMSSPEAQNHDDRKPTREGGPKVFSTWSHGLAANEAAWRVLAAGGRALDAVELGVRVSEADPEVTTVGYGGWPDARGRVTLDACIMDEAGNAGAVAYLQHIKHPISVARRVMEETPHVFLAGEGALAFALEQGFAREDLLTPTMRRAWEEWKRSQAPKPPDATNHDTISMLAIDRAGNLSGACTTSGSAWKRDGRVGDSPIIGAGLYVDNDIGAAGATGVGEEILKICGSFLVVELMRQGVSPHAACEAAVNRAAAGNPDFASRPVSFLALNKAGETGAFSTKNDFQAALCDGNGNNRLIEVGSLLPGEA